MRVPLDDGWIVRAVGECPKEVAGKTIPASVPGCIHLDLLAAGIIADPYLDCNELAVAWVGRVDWRYETTFVWDGYGRNTSPGNAASDGSGDDYHIDLVALGLDTIATVELNGSVIARTSNMHRSYRFPVAGLLRNGVNQLAITFAAGLQAAERASEELGPRPHVNTHPYNAIRKMACNYGWDWGPELVTAGIWRPIRLESWRCARLAAVRPLVDVDGTNGHLRVHVDVQWTVGNAEPLRLGIEVGGLHVEQAIAAGETSAVVEVVVPDVALWWPHGYGDQHLYPVSVTLSGHEAHLDGWQGRVGFRNVSLDTQPDVHGTPFTLRINDVAIFARGVNWIPDDAFPSRVTPQRYATRLSQAKDANVNLVRVWGGGIYESEDFYNVCDELGLLVWQDFLFACAAYAEEEPLRSEVAAEARAAVSRLSAHPSLVLWNGNNENIWGHEDWGWKQSLQGRTWGWGYYTDILPSIVAELDPTRPYSPGSPYSMSPDRPPNDPDHGTMHIWDVWNQVDYSVYRGHLPRFVSEFGFQGPPTWATLTRSIHDEPLTPDSPGMLLHQKAEDGNGKLLRGLLGHLPVPTTMDDWHWATSLNQARAIRLGVEHFRSWSPQCMGAIVWQFNDCWPVTSWSAIDGDGRRKPLWYALRQSFTDRLLTFQPRAAGLALVAVNDSSERWTGLAEITRRELDGTVLVVVTAAFDLDARCSTTVALSGDVATAGDPAHEILVAVAGENRAFWHFCEDVEAALAPPDLDVALNEIAGGYRLSVTTRSLLRDLSVLADKVAPDAVADDMLVTLLPGETATFDIRTESPLTLAQLTGPTVLRSANQLLSSTRP